MKKDLKESIGKDWPQELKDKVDFTSIELVGVNPRYITGYVTEKGIIRPSDLMQFVYKEGLDV